MTPRTMISNPLLLKELASQARRPGRPGWAYPGPIWFLVVTLVPAIVFLRQGEEANPRPFFLVAALFQMWLLAFRSTLYTSTSMASDVRQGTLPVLLSTPLSLSASLRAKLTACLLPLWLELLLSVPLALVVYSWQGGLPPAMIATVAAFLACASLLFGGLGMWLGGLLGDAEKAAKASRLLVGILLVATALGPQHVHGVIVLVGILLWVCLVWLPQVRPNQAVQGSIAALLILLVLPVIFAASQDLMRNFNLSVANPMHALWTFNALPAGPEVQTPESLLLLGVTYAAAGLGLLRMALGRARSAG